MPRIETLLMIALAIGPLASQQQCWATHAGEPLNSNTVTGGPNMLLAFKVTAPSALSIAAVQVETGLRAGSASMAIWSHDAANDRPGAPLGPTGSYQQCTPIAWQGAALPTPVSVTPGQVFWAVWGMPSSSRTPWSTLGNGTVQYRASFDGGQIWNGQNNGQNPWPAKPYKIRFFCSYVTVPFATTGQGKAGGGGLVPDLVVTGWPANGNEVDVVLKQAAPSAPAVLVVGPPQQTPIVGLGTLYTTPLIVLSLQTSSGRTPGTGTVMVPIPLPGPSSIGFPLSFQYWVIDAAAQAGLSHTAGVGSVIS